MRVKNFAGFMRTRKMNESDSWNEGSEEYQEGEDGYGMSPEDDYGYFGANPEEEETEEGAEGEEGEEGADEELTLEDLKAMIDDLTERVKKLEPEEEEAEEGEEGEEGAEGEEPAEGEAKPEA